MKTAVCVCFKLNQNNLDNKSNKHHALRAVSTLDTSVSQALAHMYICMYGFESMHLLN